MVRFATLLFIILIGSVAFADVPDKPDLSVIFIQRLPRNVDVKFDYPGDIPEPHCSCLSQPEPGRGRFRYKPNPKPSNKPAYKMNDTELKEFCRHRPLPGDKIFFTAHVKNQGGAPSPEAPYVFSIDKKAVLKGKIPKLAPGEKTKVSIKWTWKSGDHTVNFKVTPQAEEICDKNDEREILADAVSLVTRTTTREVYDAFAATQNMIGSYSFEDWCQHHIDVWNESLAKAVYTSIPNSVSERIRFDGAFSSDDPELPERVHWRLSYRMDMIPKMAKTVDSGLIHELVHQCGIIDLYAMFFMPTANPVRRDDGQYLFIGHMHAQIGLMGGGAAANKNTMFSEHTARGLELMKGWPRGGYGIYMFDMPKHNIVRLLDNTDKPLAGAKVLLHQANRSGSLGKKPPLKYTTDSRGEVDLGDFPFDLIHVVGRTGSLLFEIRAPGQLEYHFLDLPQMNIAYWRGDEEKHIYVIKTGIAHRDSPAAPTDLQAKLLSNKKILLTWKAANNPKSFRVLRNDTGLDCSLDRPFAGVADLPGSVRRAEVEAPHVGYPSFYAIAVVDDKGRQGAYSNVLRVPDYEIYPHLVRPWGVALDSNGTAYTVDNHSGILYSVDKDGRQTGWRGQIRVGPGNVAGIAVSADASTLYIAGRRSGRIAVADLAGKKRITGTIGAGELKKPWGIAVSKDGTIFVADAELNQVVLFDRKGKKISTIDDDLNKPRAVAIDDSRGLLCVGDSGNDRLKVYQRTGTDFSLVKTIDNVLNAECVAFGPKGRIYVGHEIRLGPCRRGMTVYNPDGELVGEWLQKPFAYRRERYVYGLAVAPDGSVFLTHGGNERWFLKLSPEEIEWKTDEGK